MRTQNNTKIFDSNLLFKDAGLVAASAAATVAAAAKVVDLGIGFWQGRMIIDATAVEVASGDEVYNVCVQLSNSATFASGIVTAAKLELGDAAALLGDADAGAGRYKLYFDNEFGATYYRYARIYTVVAGDIATGINYSAHAARI